MFFVWNIQNDFLFWRSVELHVSSTDLLNWLQFNVVILIFAHLEQTTFLLHIKPHSIFDNFPRTWLNVQDIISPISDVVNGQNRIKINNKMARTAGYTRTDYKTNTHIEKELKITPILDKLLEYKRNWIQHVNRMPRNRLSIIIIIIIIMSPSFPRNIGCLWVLSTSISC